MGFETEMRGIPEKYKKEVNDLIWKIKLFYIYPEFHQVKHVNLFINSCQYFDLTLNPLFLLNV